MNENKIKRLEQLLQARQREFATKWGLDLPLYFQTSVIT
ncbi:hypothetical protein AB70_4756 [Escherichia coli 1-176-05_S1_C3]|nr:hypothetical protein AB11_4653 [Escherichia coli 1-176-05_S1_C1]EZK04510.1 hypothetical protein AB70_4992 [Escherichia coli 1-176-05_S1_C3]EZK04767.1 hypothetical protein AB70_4756 [Escherichia coli 1-176-05_S1_C3]